MFEGHKSHEMKKIIRSTNWQTWNLEHSRLREPPALFLCFGRSFLIVFFPFKDFKDTFDENLWTFTKILKYLYNRPLHLFRRPGSSFFGDRDAWGRLLDRAFGGKKDEKGKREQHISTYFNIQLSRLVKFVLVSLWLSQCHCRNILCFQVKEVGSYLRLAEKWPSPKSLHFTQEGSVKGRFQPKKIATTRRRPSGPARTKMRLLYPSFVIVVHLAHFGFCWTYGLVVKQK